MGVIEMTLVFVAAMVVVVTTLTELIAKRFIGTNGFATQIVSWALSIGLMLLTLVVQIGIIPDWVYGLEIYWRLIIGVMIGLVANGFFDIPFIQRLLELLKIKQK